MAEKIAELYVEVKAKTDQLERDINKLKTKTNAAVGSMGKNVSSLGGTFSSLKGVLGGLGIAAGITTLVNITKAAVVAAKQQVVAEQKVKQALLNSGNAAGFTAKELFKVADALEKTTGVDTIDILNDITNVLLTFNKVQGDVFTRAQVAALDLSAALGTDLRGSTIQLAKALQDPVKGMNAMSRSGVSFTDQEKQMVKQLVATNKTFEAQSLILDVVEAQVKGQAKAAFDAEGGLGKLQVTVGNLSKAFGQSLIPALDDLSTFLDETMGKSEDASEIWIVLGNGATVVATSIKNVVNLLKTFIDVISGVVKTVVKLVNGDFVGAWDEITNTIGDGVDNVIKYGEDYIGMFGKIGDSWTSTADEIKSNPIKPVFDFSTGKIVPFVLQPRKKQEDETVTTTFKSSIPAGYTADQVAMYETLKFAANDYAQYAQAVIELAYQNEVAAAEDNAEKIFQAAENKKLALAQLKYDEAANNKEIGDQIVADTIEQYNKEEEAAKIAKDKRIADAEDEKNRKAEIQESADSEFIGRLAATNEKAYNLEKQRIDDALKQMLEADVADEEAEAIHAERMMDLDNAVLEAKINNQQTLANLAGALASLFPQQTAAYKAMAITEATIAGILAVQKALASGPPPWNFIQAAAVGIAAGVNVAKIAGAHSGGTFENGKKVASFAGGGDFTVPQGFPQDSFPLLAESGERIKITPSGRVGEEAKLLAGIGGKLDALNKNLAMKNMTANVAIDIDGKKLVKQVTKPNENRLRRTGLNLDAL